MVNDWIDTSKMDPRLPTEPEYVKAEALMEAYRVEKNDLISLALSLPNLARESSGNPWTESHGHDHLFLHEPTVAAKYSRR